MHGASSSVEQGAARHVAIRDSELRELRLAQLRQRLQLQPWRRDAQPPQPRSRRAGDHRSNRGFGEPTSCSASALSRSRFDSAIASTPESVIAQPSRLRSRSRATCVEPRAQRRRARRSRQASPRPTRPACGSCASADFRPARRASLRACRTAEAPSPAPRPAVPRHARESSPSIPRARARSHARSRRRALQGARGPARCRGIQPPAPERGGGAPGVANRPTADCRGEAARG